MPGLIDARLARLAPSLQLKTVWNDRVARRSIEPARGAAATNHLRNTLLLAGFTTIRDLGTEGAGYADVGLKQAVQQGIIPGPRWSSSRRAIVATGSYGPKGYAPGVARTAGRRGSGRHPTASSASCATRSVKGADWVKVYADYRWGAGGLAHATFTLD